MIRRNLIALLLFGTFYVGFGVFLSLTQERIIYQPSGLDFSACTALLEATLVVASGTRLYTYLRPDRPTAVLYHGNAGAACDRSFYTRLFTEAGYGYVLVEYAGFGGDPLLPTHTRIKADVRNVIDYLNTKGITNSVVVGESIGSGVASYHASLSPPRALVLITPFTDLVAVARTQFWFYPTSLLVDNAFDNVTALQGYKGRVLIIHGKEDTIIPHHLGRTLYESLATDAILASIPGANHNDLFTYPETAKALQEFLAREVNEERNNIFSFLELLK